MKVETAGGRSLHVQFEERVRDLQHQDVRVVVFVADQHALARAPHAVRVIMFFQALEAREHRGVLFGLVLFCAEGIVA